MITHKMGQVVSVPYKDAIDISDVSVFLSDMFTVVRADQSHERGWSACEYLHDKHENVTFESIVGAKVVVRVGEEPDWRILMHNDKSGNEELFGWRRLSTIWPTRFDGDEEAIQTWRAETEAKLDVLYNKHYLAS